MKKKVKDNFDLDKEGVKKLLLKELSSGQVFWPSDMADKHNLDLQTVMAAVADLIKSKHLKVNQKIPK